jgi:hypothetical protein
VFGFVWSGSRGGAVIAQILPDRITVALCHQCFVGRDIIGLPPLSTAPIGRPIALQRRWTNDKWHCSAQPSTYPVVIVAGLLRETTHCLVFASLLDLSANRPLGHLAGAACGTPSGQSPGILLHRLNRNR